MAETVDPEGEDAELIPLGAALAPLDAEGGTALRAVDASVERLFRQFQLPVDAPAEKRVLAAMLRNAPVVVPVVTATGLARDEFAAPARGALFAAIVDMHARAIPVDEVTVRAHLEQTGQLGVVGGLLGEVVDLDISIGAAADHARFVRRKAALREVIKQGQDIVAAAATADRLGASTVDAIVVSAESTLGKMRARLNHRQGRFEALMAKARDAFHRAGAHRRTWDKPAGKSALELFKHRPPPPRWVIRGLVRERGVHVYGSPPKHGKTWDECEMAIGVSSGTPVFREFQVDMQGPVLMFLLEDAEEDVATRNRALVNGREMDPELALKHVRVEARGVLDLNSDEDCAGIIASAWAFADEVGEPPVLICIDPLRDANTLEENSNDDMRTIMHRVRMIRDVLGCAVVLVHHLSKPGESKGAMASGSIFDKFRGAGAIRGAWDGGIGKEPKLRTPTCIKCRVEAETRGGRAAGTFGLQLDIVDDQWGNAVRAEYTFFRDHKMMMETSTPAAKPEARTATVDDVVRCLRIEWCAAARAAREPVGKSVRALETELKAMGLTANKTTISEWVRALVNARHPRISGTPGGVVYLPKPSETTEVDDR